MAPSLLDWLPFIPLGLSLYIDDQYWDIFLFVVFVVQEMGMFVQKKQAFKDVIMAKQTSRINYTRCNRF